MKKRILFIIMAVLTFVVVLSACGGKKNSDTNTNTGTNPPAECTHNWESQSSTATCTTAGIETFKCSLCQATKEENAAALGHDMQFVDTVAPTCKEGGWDNYACARENCDATEKRHETEPSYAPEAHDFQDVGVAPTCTTAGYEDRVCSRCGNSAGARVPLYALGHTYERADFDGTTGATRVEPTCETNGSITYTCQADGCGETVTKTYEDLTGAEATEADKALAATLAMLGHKYEEAEDKSNVKEEVKPTCTTAGYIIHTCQNGCGGEQKTVSGYEKLNHTFERNPDESSWTYVTTLEPTCITKGTAWVVCTEEGCGYNTKDDEVANPKKYSKDVDPTGVHVFDKNPTVTEPTCVDAGYTTYYCSADAGCTASEDRDDTAPTNHGNGESWELIPEDLKDGKPFCKTDGNWNYQCKDCKATAYNVKGDTPIENAIHTGYTKGDFTGGIAPTCVTRGKYYCSECETLFEGYPDDTAADATNVHTYDKKGEVTPSTCTVYGYTTYHCSGDKTCTASERRDYTPLAAHDYSDPSDDGTITCFKCAKSYRDVTTATKTDVDTLCTCGNKGTAACKCQLKVEFIATKAPDAAFDLTADTAFSKVFLHDIYEKDENGNIKEDEDGDPIVTGQEYYGPALIILNGEAGTTYTITVYDENDVAITTYDIIVDGEDVGDANVVTSVSGAVAKVSLEEVWEDIAKVEITASTAATVQMYYAI